MKLKVIEKVIENKEDYELHYYRIKFLGEILEVSKDNISFIDIMQMFFERKAGRYCFIAFRKYPNSLKWKIIIKFWSKLEWYWRKLYRYNRRYR